jgi:hypothetical protein
MGCPKEEGEVKCEGELTSQAKVVIHVDEDASAIDLPLEEEEEPRMSIRLQPMAGGLCRFSYITTADDEGERTVIDMNEVTQRIATASTSRVTRLYGSMLISTVHRFGIFRFRVSNNSAPTTPSSTAHRLRPAMINFDAISRNLFGTGSMSTRGSSSASGGSYDMFGTTSTKRTKSSASRTSTIETSRFSIEMRSPTELSPRNSKRLSRQSSSPSEASREMDELVPGSPYKAAGNGQSEVDLNERLMLARRNSKSVSALQPGKPAPTVAELKGMMEERQSLEQAEASLIAACEYCFRDSADGSAIWITNSSPRDCPSADKE